jgi:hypothetical protein
MQPTFFSVEAHDKRKTLTIPMTIPLNNSFIFLPPETEYIHQTYRIINQLSQQPFCDMFTNLLFGKERKDFITLP